MESQIAKIKKHLREKGHITSWEAIVNYRATRLSAIIYILRQHGWEIESVNVETINKAGDRVHFTEYFYKGENNE